VTTPEVTIAPSHSHTYRSLSPARDAISFDVWRLLAHRIEETGAVPDRGHQA
jgi:hypothetical protein